MFLCEWLPCVCVHVAAANVSSFEAILANLLPLLLSKAPFTHSLTHSRSLSLSLTHSSTHSPTHSHTHSLSLSPLQFSKSMSSKTTVKSSISLSLGPCLDFTRLLPSRSSSPSLSSLSSYINCISLCCATL